MDKDITKDTHGPWHVLPIRDNILVDATSTIIPNAVVTTPTSLHSKKVEEYQIAK